MQPLKSVSGVLVAGAGSIHGFDDDFTFCACAPPATAATASIGSSIPDSSCVASRPAACPLPREDSKLKIANWKFHPPTQALDLGARDNLQFAICNLQFVICNSSSAVEIDSAPWSPASDCRLSRRSRRRIVALTSTPARDGLRRATTCALVSSSFSSSRWSFPSSGIAADSPTEPPRPSASAARAPAPTHPRLSPLLNQLYDSFYGRSDPHSSGRSRPSGGGRAFGRGGGSEPAGAGGGSGPARADARWPGDGNLR